MRVEKPERRTFNSCGIRISLSASPVFIPHCFVPLIAANRVRSGRPTHSKWVPRPYASHSHPIFYSPCVPHYVRKGEGMKCENRRQRKLIVKTTQIGVRVRSRQG